VLLRLGRWEESYEALTSALKLENFSYAEASYNLGRLYAARGQADLAVREWRRVLFMNPEHAGAKEALSRVPSADRIVVERSNSARAATPPAPVITTASDKPSTPKPSPTSGQPTPQTLRLDQASYNFLQQARTSLERGNALAAIDNYKSLISRQGGYFAPANLELSFAYLSLKRYDEALSNLLLVANRDGARYPISYFHLARVYELQGNLPQAQVAFSKAVKAFGLDNPQFLLDVSRVLEKQGEYKGALAAMETYIGVMKQQGQDLTSTEERLTVLRQKVATAPAPKN
jgi:tetratricopeptide (TPR) repeat protein